MCFVDNCIYFLYDPSPSMKVMIIVLCSCVDYFEQFKQTNGYNYIKSWKLKARKLNVEKPVYNVVKIIQS